MEPNLLGIKEVQKLLKIYLKEWKISPKSLYIITNKKSINSNYLSPKNKIYEIKENKIYNSLINNYFKIKILLNNKYIKKELNNILNKIES